MRRRMLGIIALMLIVGGYVGLYLGGGTDSQWGFLSSSASRAGLVLGALWLAFPKVTEISSKFPPWLLGVTIVGGVVVAIRPRYAFVIVPLVSLLFVLHGMGIFLRPAAKRRASRSRPPK